MGSVSEECRSSVHSVIREIRRCWRKLLLITFDGLDNH